MTDPPDLYGKLEVYAGHGRYPWHMPGHKRHGAGFIDPFRIDITEIEGFDDLHHPEGILQDAMKLAKEAYGSGRSWFLVNGSTCGILASLFAGFKPSGHLLMSRNCHKSAYHGALLLNADTAYVYPEVLDRGFYGRLAPEKVEAAFQQNPDISAVMMVSPGYEGIVSDIAGIAEIVHAHGAVLIVDEAHGAHLPFAGRKSFPASALDCGADLVIQSLHKTLPSLTQTAILHMSRDCMEKGRISPEKVSFYLSVFQTSSPSYVLMASIDRCVRLMAGSEGKRMMQEYEKNLMTFRKQMSRSFKRLHLMEQEDAEPRTCREPVYGRQTGGWRLDLQKESVQESKAQGPDQEEVLLDPSKIVLWIDSEIQADSGRGGPGAEPEAGAGDSRAAAGPWLARQLRDRYNMEPEMVSENHVILMTSPADRKEAFDKLADALLQIDESLAGTDIAGSAGSAGSAESAGSVMGMLTDQAPEAVMEPGRAFAMQGCSQSRYFRDAAGCICCDYIYIYPPGIPLMIPGEKIGQAQIDVIAGWREAGLDVHGLRDDGHIRCFMDIE
ncbi:MAG: aminotransferase class V-fold PLP-dependent enzyme [Lachnospiraceae bacterium]|nr:aminotransferase class V-fold PLP-dependent enzyme [Lachnospiraceae bacterium]